LKNPYITDRPLTDQDLFFGREAQFKQLVAFLNAGQSLLLLYGRRSIGKTSFLNQLPLRLGARYTVRRIEWPPPTDRATDLLWVVMEGASQALAQTAPDPQGYAAEPERYALDYLRSLAAHTTGKTVLICLDALPLAAFAAGGEGKETLARLRAALKEIGGLAVLLAIEGSPTDTDLRVAFPDLPQITLGALQPEETEELLTSPVRGVLALDYEALRQVHRLTGGYPLFAQLFGRAIFDQRLQAGWAGMAEVERAIEQVLAHGASQFQALWEACTPAARIVLSAFAEMMSYYHGVGAGKDVSLYLSRLGVQMPEEDIATSLDELVAREALERLGGDTFRFTSELLRHWLKRNHKTIETIRQAHGYRRVRIHQVKPERRKRTDWLGLALWIVAGLLVVLIGFVWRSRNKGIIWTGAATPTPAAAETTPGAVPTTVPATPDTGVPLGRIVYMAKEKPEGTWQIYSMRSDGSDPTRLTSNESNDTLPAWSPDGRKIAFVSDRDGNREIYVMNADGNEQINLTRNPADDWTPTWSPDGKYIAFASFRHGDWELYLMDSRGTNPTRLTKSEWTDSHPAWSPDGRRIAFDSNRDGNLEIYIVNVDGSTPVRFTHDEATDQNPAWSPDGQELFWESYRDGNMEIYAAKVDGSALRNVTRDAQANDHGPTCSPWGRRIAFFSNRDGGWDIYTLDLEAGVRVNLTFSAIPEQAPNWGR